MFESIRSFLIHPLIAGPVIGGIVVLLAYADSKIRDVKREKETYYKLFTVTSLIGALVVYLVVEEFTKTDEFLNQTYDTDIPGDLTKHGGATDIISDQVTMKGPPTSVEALNDLVPGEYVSMRSERVRSRRSGKRR